MMFITPTPPTSSPIELMTEINSATDEVIWRNSSAICCALEMPKLSGLLYGTFLRRRSKPRIWSSASDIRAVIVFRLAEEPSALGPRIKHFFIRWRRPVVIYSRNFLAQITGRDHATRRPIFHNPRKDADGDCPYRRAKLLD